MTVERTRVFCSILGHRLRKACRTQSLVSSCPIRDRESRKRTALLSAKLQLEEAIEHVNSMRSQLYLEIQDVKIENRQLMSRVRGLERLIEQHVEELSSSGNADTDPIIFDEDGNSSFALSVKLSELEEDVIRLTQKIDEIEDKSKKIQGKKTIFRIAKIEEILKDRGGSQSFKQLQMDLGLSPSQFTYLVSCLDASCIEVKRCPGSQRGEKMLSLK